MINNRVAEEASKGVSIMEDKETVDYGTSGGFFSFASQLGRQLTQDAMELSNSAVETAKYIAQESTKVVEKASIMAQETLADAFEPEIIETYPNSIDDLPWIDENGNPMEHVKEDIFMICNEKSNFMQLTMEELAPIFDIDRFLQVAPQLLALDEQLRQRHFELSYKVAEDVFWGNYFYQCHLIRVKNGLTPYLPMDLFLPIASNQSNEEDYHPLDDNDHEKPCNQSIEVEFDDQEMAESKKKSTFSSMKVNLMQRSTIAKQKIQNIKRKIHFPSPEKIKELQSSLLRSKSNVTESFERLSITSMNFTGLKRSPSLRMRSKSGASESDELETVRLSELGTPPSATARQSHTFDE